MYFPNGFTIDFWTSFQATWNENYLPKFEIFGNVKSVFIEITDFSQQSAEVYWDDKGKINKINLIANSNLQWRFSATQLDWTKFLTKEISATKLLMQGKLKFNGSPMFLLKYGTKFELLSDIAMKIKRYNEETR